MSKVVIRTHYSVGGKSVGGGFTNYIARRDRVDKTINARRSEVFPKYAAERPGVITMGEHGLFGQEDYVNLRKASEEIYNSVVVVYTETGVGSGFSIKENLIITNAHVVGNNRNVAINLYDSTTIKGQVIKSDIEKDLALIEIDKQLTPLNVNADNISIGQEVYAIGVPKDMPYTMTKGIISALDRKLGQNTYIQIDASVNSGNSGGPLVDDAGNVLGIITLKANDAEGIGFALNASEILAFAEDVKNTPDGTTDEAETSKEKTQDEKNADLIRLAKENETLKITVIILSVLLVLSLLINIKIRVKKKKKDEFDFEIEIEE